MRYEIMRDGTVINVIEASAEFCADYCAANGYTYQEALLPPPPEPEPTEIEQLRAQVADLQNQILTMRLGG